MSSGTPTDPLANVRSAMAKLDRLKREIRDNGLLYFFADQALLDLEDAERSLVVRRFLMEGLL